MHDLVLIGGGLSSCSVLIRLAAGACPPSGTKVILIDPAGETGGGAAYHRSVHPALLLNDPVAKIDRTGLGFKRWLTFHSAELLRDMERFDDRRVAEWKNRFGARARRGDVASLYVPRHWFGSFIRERFAEVRAELARAGVSVTIVRAAATDVRQVDDGWLVTLDRSGPVFGRAVVLGTGGPCEPGPMQPAGYLRGRPGLDLYAVEDAIVRAGGGDVLLLGSGASGVEMVYCIDGDPRLRTAADRIVAISPRGRLPDGARLGRGALFLAVALGRGATTAAELMDALESDVTAARVAGLTIPDTYPVLHSEFLRVFEQLPDAEKKRVVDVHSRRYLALLRKTSPIYSAGASSLARAGKLVNVAGRVTAVEPTTDGFEVFLDDGRSLTGRTVLDCRGFADLSGDPLIKNMITSGTVRCNDSGLGLLVDAGFEAAPGLTVLGPLLAGTAQGGEYIWHLEDIPRIYAYADRVAASVSRRIAEDSTEHQDSAVRSAS